MQLLLQTHNHGVLLRCLHGSASSLLLLRWDCIKHSTMFTFIYNQTPGSLPTPAPQQSSGGEAEGAVTLLPHPGPEETCREGPSLLLGLCPGPLNLVGRRPICGSSAVGQYKAQLCLIPALDGHVCSLSHIPMV